MDIFHVNTKLKADILEHVTLLRKTCVAEKTYFRTMECWKYLDKNQCKARSVGLTLESP